MKLIIPFTKDIKFNTNIAEITSISLEHDYTFSDGELLGNFNISGEYKTHEVSVNKESFEYVLPFSVSLSDRVIDDSIDLEIKDFTYDIKDNNTLVVSIEYEVRADENEENNNRDEEFEQLLDAAIERIDKKIEMQPSISEKSKEDTAKEILEKTNNNEETFVTYHIHIMQDNDTIESICTKYKTNENLLKDYNDIASLTVGDKLIIPNVDE